MNKLGLVAVLAVLACVSPAGWAEGRITGVQDVVLPNWWKLSFLDLKEDAGEAADADKHLILFFHLEGCPYCAKMAAENFSTSPYVDFLKKNFDVVDLDSRGAREVITPDGRIVTERAYARELEVFYTPSILFLNGNADVVLRVDGYRPDEQFEPLVRYVAENAYERESADAYILNWRARQRGGHTLAAHPLFVDAQDLTRLTDRPVMLVFEDSGCTTCPDFHKDYLDDDFTRSIIDGVHVVRWDAASDESVIDYSGAQTTPRALAETLGVRYRPGLVFIDGDRVIHIIDSHVVLYHFHAGLDYIASGAFRTMSRREFGSIFRERYLKQRDVDYSIEG